MATLRMLGHDFNENFPDNRIQRYDDFGDVIQQLHNGTAEGVYLTSKHIIDYINLLNSDELRILYTKDVIQLLPFSVYFQKDSCILETFNRQISALTESGLIESWIERFTKQKVRLSENAAPMQMKLDQLIGIFYITACLLILSLLLFLLELFSNYNASIKSFLDFCSFQSTK